MARPDMLPPPPQSMSGITGGFFRGLGPSLSSDPILKNCTGVPLSLPFLMYCEYFKDVHSKVWAEGVKSNLCVQRPPISSSASQIASDTSSRQTSASGKWEVSRIHVYAFRIILLDGKIQGTFENSLRVLEKLRIITAIVTIIVGVFLCISVLLRVWARNCCGSGHSVRGSGCARWFIGNLHPCSW